MKYFRHKRELKEKRDLRGAVGRIRWEKKKKQRVGGESKKMQVVLPLEETMASKEKKPTGNWGSKKLSRYDRHRGGEGRSSLSSGVEEEKRIGKKDVLALVYHIK